MSDVDSQHYPSRGDRHRPIGCDTTARDAILGGAVRAVYNPGDAA